MAEESFKEVKNNEVKGDAASYEEDIDLDMPGNTPEDMKEGNTPEDMEEAAPASESNHAEESNISNGTALVQAIDVLKDPVEKPEDKDKTEGTIIDNINNSIIEEVVDKLHAKEGATMDKMVTMEEVATRASDLSPTRSSTPVPPSSQDPGRQDAADIVTSRSQIIPDNVFLQDMNTSIMEQLTSADIQCDVCGKSQTTVANLQAHLLTNHCAQNDSILQMMQAMTDKVSQLAINRTCVLADTSQLKENVSRLVEIVKPASPLPAPPTHRAAPQVPGSST